MYLTVTVKLNDLKYHSNQKKNTCLELHCQALCLLHLKVSRRGVIRENNGLLPRLLVQQADPGFLTEAVTFLRSSCWVCSIRLHRPTSSSGMGLWLQRDAKTWRQNVDQQTEFRQQHHMCYTGWSKATLLVISAIWSWKVSDVLALFL